MLLCKSSARVNCERVRKKYAHSHLTALLPYARLRLFIKNLMMLKMQYSFTCFGHRNITSRHRNTLEFTKDKELSLKGDCIIGVGADFSLEGIKKFMENKIKSNDKIENAKDKIPIKITIKMDDIAEEINGLINPEFNDAHEIVIRTTGFVSERTLVVGADKAAKDIGKGLMELFRNPANKMTVILE